MLKSENVYLAPFEDQDSRVLFNWINDRNIVLWNSYYKPVTHKQHQEWFNSLEKRDDLVIFGIRLIETGELIGSCQLHSINPVDRHAELQIRIAKEEQMNKGYGTEALKLLLDFAFTDLNLARVYLYVFSTNTRAVKAYEKVGFVQEGCLRRHAHINGEYLDVHVMGLLRDDFNG
jgi:RimJ/RimL family protein N-acetyltransferase